MYKYAVHISHRTEYSALCTEYGGLIVLEMESSLSGTALSIGFLCLGPACGQSRAGLLKSRYFESRAPGRDPCWLELGLIGDVISLSGETQERQEAELATPVELERRKQSAAEESLTDEACIGDSLYDT